MAASAAIFIGFGQPVRGREQQALRLFDEAVQYYTRLQEQREIDSFEAALLEPHGGDLGGFVLVRGERSRLDEVRASAAFIRLTTRASTVVEHFGVVSAFIGDELNRQFASYSSDIADLVR
jgi:hypothetical protein